MKGNNTLKNTSGNITESRGCSLKIDKGGRFLSKDGKPFFWLGDTAWELIHRLDRKEVDRYLTNRKEKGFNVIQCVLLAELDGLTSPNAYGHLPLINLNPLMPDLKPENSQDDAEPYDYWEHADYIIDRCAEMDIYVGLLPTWGDKVLVKWGSGPQIFNADKAYGYGKFLGRRYNDRDNIIWILGGDRPGIEGNNDMSSIWRAMAEGIADGVNGKEKPDGKADFSTTMMTYHPVGGKSSADWFHEEEWLDFNMYQSGHSQRDNAYNWNQVAADWDRIPVKPVINGEPVYEDNVINQNQENGWFDDYDVRKDAYRSVFGGGMGITYGSHGIWQMYAPGRTAVNSCRTYWFNSLDFKGAFQMKYLKDLMLSRPYFSRLPYDRLIDSMGNAGGRMAATIAADSSYAMVYFPKGDISVTVYASKLSGTKLNAWWYNPRDGKCYTSSGIETKEPFGVFEKADSKFEPPDENSTSDWVLILDDADKNYGIPGQTGNDQ